MRTLLLLLVLVTPSIAGAQENRSSCSPGEITIHYNDQPGLIVLEQLEDLAMNHIMWQNTSEGSVTVECTPNRLYINVDGTVTLRINMQKGQNLNVWANGNQALLAQE